MKKHRKFIIMCRFFSVLIALAIISGNAYAVEKRPAGKTIFVYDDVWRIAADQVKKELKKSDSVYETDTILTGKNGSAQLLMSDGAYIAVRPNTSIRLDVYRYDKKKEEGLGESVITLLKGCFRSITGLIGKQNKENYRIKTAVANIGIRGTDHEPLYIPEPEEGEVPIGEPGLYDKVNSGETYLENEAGVFSILPNQVGFVSDQNSIAVVEDTIPDVYEAFTVTVSEGSVDSPEEQSVVASGEDFSSSTSPQEQVFVQQPPPEMPAVTADPEIQYAGFMTWPDTVDYKGVIGVKASETDINKDESGTFTGYDLPSQDMPDPSDIKTVRLVNPTSGTRQEASHYAETGIEFGTWEADAIERVKYDGTVDSSPVGNGLVHWITGPLPGTDYLSQVISGTQVYTFDGGTAPTNQDGVVGTLNSATLSVDFSRQSVDADLQLTVGSYNWSASATDISLDRGTFTESSPFLTVQRDGTATPNAWGQLSGSLVGDSLNGAVIGYTLGDTSISETINGTASFYGADQNTTTTYREIGIAGTDTRAPLSTMMASFAASSAANISADGSGNITGFDAMIPKYSVSPSGEDQSPVHFDIGTATLTDTGTDTESGMIWGRWSGTVDATDRVTGSVVAPSFNTQDLHFISGPEVSAAVVLPITGTRTYEFAGGTQPTDNLGNVGTLNSATLSADFTNMTVATGINATVGSTTFDATSSAAPIESGRYFNATHNDSLTIACTGTGAGTTNSGIISGAFYGSQGDSAGVVYSFNTTDGGSINTTVSGAAGFK